MQAGVLITGRWDNTLRPEAVVSFDELYATVHEARGPAGTKDEESPYKEGPAIVPVLPDWTVPACECPAFADRAPAARHRAIRCTSPAVRTMAPAIWLDVDEAPYTEACAMLERLEGLEWFAWTTHSYGRIDKGRAMAIRLVVRCREPYEAELASAVRRGFAAAYGIPLDPKCLSPIALFYLPSCPDVPARRACAWTGRSAGRYVEAAAFADGGPRDHVRTVGTADELAPYVVPDEERRVPTMAEILALIRVSGPKVAHDLHCFFVTKTAWGEPKARDERLHVWAGALLKKYPWVDPELTAELGAASCAAVEAEDGQATTVDWVASKLRSKIPRAAQHQYELAQASRFKWST